MNILIDDERSYLPDGSVPDIICRNYTAATNYFLKCWQFWAEDDTLYIDHDLGTEDPNQTGYDVLTWMEQRRHLDPKYELPGKIVIVSDNPAGRQRMELVIEKLYQQV